MIQAHSTFIVIALCAQWCGVCREFYGIFGQIAARQANASFFWLDVEDQSELLGDIEVDDFPTLAIYREGLPVYFGTTIPQVGVIERLLKNLITQPVDVITTSAALASLPARLAASDYPPLLV